MNYNRNKATPKAKILYFYMSRIVKPDVCVIFAVPDINR